ncbi:MAG: peptidoglycan bridge formation glycyltransferase FemA/FemB family protein [Patescibacteria group bacterium]
MELKYLTDKTQWNNFLTSQKLSSFLQSWEWGTWQEKLGRQVWRIAIVENENILAVCQFIQNFVGPKIFKQNYFYLTRGPVILEDLNEDKRQEINTLIFQEINQLAKQEKSFFVKIEPLENNFLKTSKSFIKTKNIQPADTWLLDLSQSEENLLAQMHPKTRYNFRLAQRKGVVIEAAKNIKGVESFFKILDSTSKRNEFGIYSLEYYQKLFELLSEKSLVDDFSHPDVSVYLAKFENKIIAGIWVMFFGDTATYLYGGMEKEFDNLMAPQLIQWQAIQDAKSRGYQYYDFWGIAPDGADTYHPWAGLTRFKKSFGGFEYNYPGAYELILDKTKSKLYKIIKKIK